MLRNLFLSLLIILLTVTCGYAQTIRGNWFIGCKSGVGCMDSVDGNNAYLIDGATCRVVNATEFKIYVLDASSGETPDGDTYIAPSTNPGTKMWVKVYDWDEVVDDTAYGAGWNGVTEAAPSKNAVYDEIVNIYADIAGLTYSDISGAAQSGGAEHDNFSDYVPNEHIDWTTDQGATNIHSGNIPDLSATYQPADTDLDDLADGVLTYSKVGGATASRAVVTDGSGNLAVSAATSTELGYISGLESAVQTQIDGKQASDAGLTALSSVSTGLLANTAPDTFSSRTITGTSGEVSVSNGTGVSGNPTISLPAAIDIGGKTSFELPNAADPTVSVEGHFSYDTEDDAWRYYDGSTEKHMEKGSWCQSTYWNPEELYVTAAGDTDLPVCNVRAENFPNGFVVTACYIVTDSSSSYSVDFYHTTYPGASENAMATAATSSSQEAEDTSISNATVPAGSQIFTDMPATDVLYVIVGCSGYAAAD